MQGLFYAFKNYSPFPTEHSEGHTDKQRDRASTKDLLFYFAKNSS
jgi:hypothetical protein